MRTSRNNLGGHGCWRAAACGLALLWTTAAWGQDVSPRAFLQWFESPYQTTVNRAPDLFMAGYGAVWLPPPGRADLSDFSVGYDVYDRFDLGRWDRKTLYGTEAGLKRTADMMHRMGSYLHIDAIINHNGFSDAGTSGFLNSGGYPGFLLRNPNGTPTGQPGTDGDFNSAYDYGDLRGRLAGLIDINHATNHRFVRHPVPGVEPVPGNHGGNLPAGTTPDASGRLANVPLESNRRFYPDRDGPFISVFDPTTGEQNIRIYSYNTANPMAGDPVGENATGYLMRYLQWMVQHVGVDGFRIDAAKHVEGFAFNFLDRAVYRSNPRKHLDGSTNHVFSYGEVFDGNRDFLQSFVRKDINPSDIGRIGGNRDVLDFAQYFTLRDNLTGNGFANDWRNVVYADLDFHDDGLKNGSAGVKFVQSHDDFGPHLNNVAHAYMLMHPGNSVVYFNAKQFGNNRDFPKDGRGDALGGVFGDRVTDLVEIRNTHGRGNYRERWLEKELYAFERAGSMVVLLNNRLDSGFDSRTLNVDMPFGAYLVELTGNAKAWNQQVGNADIPEVVQVFNDTGFGTPNKINVRFLRNGGGDRGYLIYGLPTPQSDNGIELSNVASVLEGGNPQGNAFSNGNTRLTDLFVIHDDSFQVKLATKAVNLLGSLRDRDADGDNALVRINDGLDLNGNGVVDFRTPAPASATYGFEQFTTFKQPGYFQGNGQGLYIQNIDATMLPEGVNFITVRAFRHREDGGPAVFSEFKKVVYIDRLPPISAPAGFKPFSGTGNNDILIESIDHTADSVHLFLNLPLAMTQEQVLQLAMDGQGQMDRVDVNLFKQGFFGVPNGNNVFSIVTFEMTGTWNVQRFTGIMPTATRGAGLGDLTMDEKFEGDDLDLMIAAILSGDSIFHAPGDFTADGRVTAADWHALGQKLVAIHNAGTLRPDGFPLVSQGTLDYYHALTSQVPEPTTLGLLLLVGVTTLRRRHRR